MNTNTMQRPKPPEGMEGKSPDEISLAIIDELDTDSDGLLSLEEGGFSTEALSAIDTDEDGFASADELTAGANEKMAGGPPPKKGGPPPVIKEIMQQSSWKMGEEGLETDLTSMTQTTTSTEAISAYQMAILFNG